MAVDHVRLSKTMSHALRHEPWVYELELDAEGWVGLEALVAALREERDAWRELTGEDVVAMMRASAKQRFEIADGRIRAFYGHSVPNKLTRTPAVPPGVLFHGTDPDVVGLIREKGLLPMSRQYVHLSADRETAVQVGRRKASAPVILEVDAGAAHEAGVVFYLGNEKVWLADVVPAAFIKKETAHGG